MKNKTVQWRLSQADASHLSSALKPIRTYREVGNMLGLSTTLVYHLEASALRKIVRAMTRLESNENPEHERE